MLKRFLDAGRCRLQLLLLSGCGYNTLQAQDEQIKAAWAEVVNQYQRRADLIPNLVEHGEGLRRAGAAGAARRHQRAREGRLDPGDARARQRSAGVRQRSSRRRASCPRRCRGCWSWRRTIRSSSPTRTSATCRRSSKAPRTASRSRATATSRRCRNTTSRCAAFPTNLTAMMFGFKEKPQFTVENEKEISKPPDGRFRQARRRAARRRPAPERTSAPGK